MKLKGLRQANDLLFQVADASARTLGAAGITAALR